METNPPEENKNSNNAPKSRPSYRVRLGQAKAFLLENRHVKQTVLKNTIWLTASNIAARVIKAALIIYAARALGVAGYGVFSYALTLSGFLSMFSDLGLGPLLTREGSKHPEKIKIYLGTSLFIKLGLVVFTVLLTIMVGPLISKIPQTISLLPLAALLLAFDSFRDFSSSLSRFREKMQIEATINIVTYVAITVIGFIALMIKPSPLDLMIGYTAGSGIGAFFSVWVFRDYYRRFWEFFDKKLVKEIFSNAWLFALMGLLGGIMLSTDTLMLGWLKNATEVGLYSAAQKPVQILFTLPGLLATSLFPTLSKLTVQNKERFRSILEKSIKFLLVMAVPIIAGGIILAKSITILLFGSAYLAAAPMFALLISTIIFTFPTGVLGNAIFAYNGQKYFLEFLIVGAISNALLNYLLIPRWGGIGASVATIIAQALVGLMMWRIMYKLNNFKMFYRIQKTLLATIVMALVVFGLQMINLNVVFNIIVGIIVYFLTLYALKEELLSKNFVLSVFNLKQESEITQIS